MIVKQIEFVVPDLEEEAAAEAEEIFPIVEHNPDPSGGYQAFYEFLFQEIKYPKQAIRSGIEGKVFVQFVVNKNGELTDFIIARGIGQGCDEEAIRVLRKAPRWQPGKQRGKPVKVRMMMPIQFTLMEH